MFDYVLQNLALGSKEIVIALRELYPDSGKAEELAGAALTLVDWADAILEEDNEELEM